MKQEKHYFRLIQFLSYLSFGLFMTNLIPFMDKLGYDSYQRGFVLSGYALCNIILQLVLGLVSDRKNTLKWPVVASFLLFGFSVAYLFLNQPTYLPLLLIGSLAGGLLNSLCGLEDTWIIGINDDFRAALSRIKAFGSLGWTVGSLLSVLIIRRIGYTGAGLLIFGLALTCAMVSWGRPDVEEVVDKPETKTGDLLRLFKLRNYVLLLMTLFLLYGMVVANTSLVVDKMIALKASDLEISLKWAMGSLLEIPMYLICMTLVNRWGARTMLMVSSLVSSVQFVLFGLAPTSWLIVLICLLQVFTTPVILVTSKLLISQMVPKHLQHSGQLLALSFYMGGSSLIIPLLSGSLGKALGFSPALLVFSLMGVLPMIILSFLKKAEP